MLNIMGIKFKYYIQLLPIIIGMSVLALVLIYVFGRSFSGADQPDVVLANNDGSQLSQNFEDSLQRIEGFDYVLASYEEGLKEVSNGRAVAMVVIEDGFNGGNAPEVTMVKSGESMEHFTLQAGIESQARLFFMDEQYLSRMPYFFDGLGIETSKDELRVTLQEQVDKYPVMTVSVESYSGEEAKGYDSLKHSFIGFILFFSMFTMVFGIGSIIEEKEQQVWQRQTVSPVSPAKVLAANMIVTVIVGTIQLSALVIISRVVFGIDWGGSIVALLLILLGYVVAVASLGLLMSGMVNTSQQLGSFSPIVIVSTSMIGGCMWPLEIITSKPLLFMANLTPQRWAYKGLKEVIVNNGGLADVTDSLILLLVISVVLFLLAMIPYQKGLKTAS